MTSGRLFRMRRRHLTKRLALGGVLAALAVALGHSCASGPDHLELAGITGEPEVLVKLVGASGGPETTLSVAAAYEVFESRPRGGPGRRIAHGTGLAGATAAAKGDEVELGGQRLGARWVELVPAEDGAVQVGPHRYRGSLLFGAGGGRLVTLNRVAMEKYLAGVLGCEMPLSWQEPALEAQAIAARTYALYELLTASRRRDWDVADTTASQVYQGKKAENERARRVVQGTRGMVLVWDGKPFKAFFHSTCGGHTADSRSVFPEHPITPLSGRPCGWCGASKVHRWTRSFPVDEVARRLETATGKRLGPLEAIEVAESEGGRARTVRIVAGGQETRLPAARFRAAIGTGMDGLLSTAFQVRLEDGRAVFAGSGWGHGVGLCQFGARGLAESGRPGTEIARYYYPGADLARFW